MITRFTLVTILCLAASIANGQDASDYQVYAVKFYDARKIAAPQMVTGANVKDSLRVCYMIWLIKGEDGRNILVDAGMIDSTKTGYKNFVRPDLVLQRINVYPSDITDIIITHPHNDHIGGINLFPGSKHTFDNQYLLVNSNSKTNRVLIASDAVWFYYKLNNLLPATLCIDPKAYVDAMIRMKTLVTNSEFIIPGHDDLVFSKFPEIAEWIVKIGN